MNLQSAPRASQALSHYPSFASVIEATRPTLPSYVLHPARFRAAVGRFLQSFPGTTMYAVKANPVAHVLDQIAFYTRVGVDAFDVAPNISVADIQAALHEISDVYQPSVDGRVTIRDLRARQATARSS